MSDEKRRAFKAVLFDADGTLFDYEKAERHALESCCREIGMDEEPEILRTAYREINGVIWRELEQSLITLQELRAERWRRFFDRFAVAHDPEDMSVLYLRHLAEGWFLLPGAEEVVTALSSCMKLAIVTNGIHEVQMPRLAASPLAGKISHMVISEDVGAAKPDPAVFDHALRLLGLSPDEKAEALMVGDSLSADIAGGSAYGMKTCWYNPGGAENSTGCVPDYEIRDLLEVLSIAACP